MISAQIVGSSDLFVGLQGLHKLVLPHSWHHSYSLTRNRTLCAHSVGVIIQTLHAGSRRWMEVLEWSLEWVACMRNLRRRPVLFCWLVIRLVSGASVVLISSLDSFLLVMVWWCCWNPSMLGVWSVKRNDPVRLKSCLEPVCKHVYFCCRNQCFECILCVYFLLFLQAASSGHSRNWRF